MEGSRPSLAETLIRDRTKARAVDRDAFDRRFRSSFDAEASGRWSEFDFVDVERRVGEVVAWAVTEVRAESVAMAAEAETTHRPQIERDASEAAARAAQTERRAQAAWARPWIKPDPRFRIAAANHGVDSVFHWTPLRSLDSILDAGIRPRAYLERHGIWFEPHSYGSWQKAVDFSNHVAVSLRPQRGMFWQLREAVLLAIDERVMARNGAFYSPGNSAGRMHDFNALHSLTAADDFEALYADPHATAPVDWQAEIWVPDGISPRRIKTIVVRDAEAFDATRSAIARGITTWHSPSVVVDADLNEWAGGTPLDLLL